ncbi:hypothetical protein PoB_001003400 [Plakobranchus ocellatus]|uniref:Uncharacterized protein n=1 Tax=Plakobranchus ocellatus TaxID=259542 RepID=A0AAV3YN97_9GAST|nr:hypothetical protein PoB_001003400 [Plakobranchus ocellatus]
MIRKEIGKTAVRTTPDTKDTTVFNTTSLTKARKHLHEPVWQRFIKALYAVPVTDSSTGFTFTSKAIYDCLNMPSQTAMPWSLKYDYKTTSPTKLEDGENFQTLKEYYPKLDKNILMTHLSQVECPVPDEISSSTEKNVSWRASESEKPLICSVTCGQPRVTIRSDGICRARHTAVLAVADDGHAPLCPSAMIRSARFFACGLEKEIEGLKGADVSATSVEVMFDSAYNNNLYVVKLSLALPEK